MSKNYYSTPTSGETEEPGQPPILSPPSLPLAVGPLNAARDLGSDVSSPSGVWSVAPVEIELSAFLALKCDNNGANNFNNSHENQLAKFLTLPDFRGNLEFSGIPPGIYA